jgi:hypothetical protein
MEFRLTYEGPLPSANKGKRAELKHTLRKHFHRQMRELWKQHPDLKAQAEATFVVQTTPPNMISVPGAGVRQIIQLPNDPHAKSWIEHIADNHQVCGGGFVPLVRKDGGFTCSLNILFLRRHDPGNFIVRGGDIDNRLKVVFDGLKMPRGKEELGDLPIDANDEIPFFCLLEDDDLITSVTVTTDRLLAPKQTHEGKHHAVLVIHVTVVNPSAIFAGNRLV